MPLEPLTTPPTLADFTPLTEHHAQTPPSFFGAKPVLHLHTTAASLRLRDEDCAAHASVRDLSGAPAEPVEGLDGEVCIPGLEVFVTSRSLLLWAPAAARGIQIPYPTIGVTAIDGAHVLLLLDLSDADTADEDIESLQLWISPGMVSPSANGDSSTSSLPAAAADGTPALANGSTPVVPHTASDRAMVLFAAISECQELNPDPPAPGEEDDDEDGVSGPGGFDPTAPGATGWITSENMAEFMDEEGNFRMPVGMQVYGGEEDEGVATGGLGEGAGRRRGVEEVDADQDGEAEAEEGKWLRTG